MKTDDCSGGHHVGAGCHAKQSSNKNCLVAFAHLDVCSCSSSEESAGVARAERISKKMEKIVTGCGF